MYAVLHDQAAVHIDFAFFAQILDNIPMQGRVIGTAALGIGSTHGQMDCTANLFIIEDKHRARLYAD